VGGGSVGGSVGGTVGGTGVGVTPARTATGPNVANPISIAVKIKSSPSEMMNRDSDIRDGIVFLTSRHRAQLIRKTVASVPKRTVRIEAGEPRPS
jgi:hypothetical protein